MAAKVLTSLGVEVKGPTAAGRQPAISGEGCCVHGARCADDQSVKWVACRILFAMMHRHGKDSLLLSVEGLKLQR